jgi:hypothetical protein|tara:strand:+ start:173 stop:304 length:132 start_codon:yes stop_codon:yes gene_type:complete
MLTYFEDPTLLAHRGFTVVHFSRLVELTPYITLTLTLTIWPLP